MCNRYGYNNPLAALQRTFSELGHVQWDGLAPNTTDLLQIRPRDRAPIIRPVDGRLGAGDVPMGHHLQHLARAGQSLDGAVPRQPAHQC